MANGSQAPEKCCEEISHFRTYLVDNTAGEHHTQRIGYLKCNFDIGIVTVVPIEFSRQIGFQQADNLAVDVIYGGSEENERANCPPILSNVLIYCIGVFRNSRLSCHFGGAASRLD